MLAYVFVVFAIAFRFIPHPWGFTPLPASLLFFGARGSKRMMWLPLVLMIGADIVLTKWVYALPMAWDQLVTWAWYAGVLWLGTNLRQNQKPIRLIGASLTTSVSFFVISNFSVWLATNLYPKTFSGLMTCYAIGLPHFRRSIAGDLFFTMAMFATPVILQWLSGAFSKDTDHAAAA
jgi:hypothetical protein